MRFSCEVFVNHSSSHTLHSFYYEYWRRKLLATIFRAGCQQVETLQHVIQSCIRTHAGVTMRHDRVVDILAEEFALKGYATEKEVHVRTSQQLFKPNMIFKKGDTGGAMR